MPDDITMIDACQKGQTASVKQFIREGVGVNQQDHVSMLTFIVPKHTALLLKYINVMYAHSLTTI